MTPNFCFQVAPYERPALCKGFLLPEGRHQLSDDGSLFLFPVSSLVPFPMSCTEFVIDTHLKIQSFQGHIELTNMTDFGGESNHTWASSLLTSKLSGKSNCEAALSLVSPLCYPHLRSNLGQNSCPRIGSSVALSEDEMQEDHDEVGHRISLQTMTTSVRLLLLSVGRHLHR